MDDDDLLSEQQRKQLDRLVSRRGLLKLSIEASPLLQTPCNIRSVAICNIQNKGKGKDKDKDKEDDQIFLYLGTDTGDIHLFIWSHPSPSTLSSSLVDARSPAENLSSSSPPSVADSPAEISSSSPWVAEANVSAENSSSPLSLVVDARFSAEKLSSVSQFDANFPGKKPSLPSVTVDARFSAEKSPYPSLFDARFPEENSSFPNLSEEKSSSSSHPDASGTADNPSNSTESKLSFSCSNSLGLTPLDCLCTLPRAGAIAVLLDKQVVLLDLFNLCVLEWLTSSRGAFTTARAFGVMENFQFYNRSHSVPPPPPPLSSPQPSSSSSFRKDGLWDSPQTPRKNAGHGQLGWLFGTGRNSNKRGGMLPVSGGDLQSKSNNPPSSQEDVLKLQDISNIKSVGIERFVVAIKQKLLLYEIIKETKLSKTEDGVDTKFTIRMKELPGPEEVITMAWLGTSIITGNYQEYTLHSVIDGHSSVLFSLPQDLISPPLLKTFPKDLEVLLFMDSIGVAINSSGNPTSSSLAFKDIPDAVGQSSAYVVLVKRGVVELFHRKTGAKVQSILLSDGPVAPHLVAEDDDGKFLVVSSAFKVYCLERVSMDEQLKELLRQRQFDEALALAEESLVEVGLENAKEKLSMVHAQAGFLLFFDLRFRDAIDHFLQSSVMHPAEIFPFFPNMTERWRGVVPRVRYWGLHPPPQAVQNVIESKLQAIQRGRILQSLSDLNGLPNGDSQIATSSRSRSSIIQEYTMQATEEVIRYLKLVRSKSMDLIMKEGVDTLLMRLLLQVGASDEMERFSASKNDCIVEEVENLLKESGQLRVLAFLYETKGMLPLALQVWQTLSEGSIHIQGKGKLSGRRIQDNQVDPQIVQLTAAKEASRLLEISSDGDLVLTHLKWILNVSQDLAIQILSSSKRSRPIPPDDVLNSLDRHEVYVQQRYLQWLVHEQGVDESRYHTFYAISLAKSALKNIQDADDSRERLQQLLQTSEKYDPNTVLILIQGSELWREQAILYRKLGDEMQVFQIYALKLGDIEAAEHYCTELGRPDAYMRLLDLYLKPGEGKEPMYNAAVHLLQLHGTALDPLQVLEAFLPDMPFQLAYSTIARLIRTRVHMQREGQIVRHLTRAENFESRVARLEQRNRGVLITDQSSCGSCFSRFGTKLFAVYPNGSVVCYKCFRNSGSNIDPITGENFGKDDVQTSQAHT